MSDTNVAKWNVSRVDSEGYRAHFITLYRDNELGVTKLLGHYQRYYAEAGEHFEAVPLSQAWTWNPVPRGDLWINPTPFPDGYKLSSEYYVSLPKST